jgi:hypothetical protein
LLAEIELFAVGDFVVGEGSGPAADVARTAAFAGVDMRVLPIATCECCQTNNGHRYVMKLFSPNHEIRLRSQLFLALLFSLALFSLTHSRSLSARGEQFQHDVCAKDR